MSTQSTINGLIKSMSGQNNILTIPRIYIDITGDIKSALFLSQCVYWSDKTGRDDGYFYKSTNEWSEELGLSKREIENARKKLVKFITTKILRANGSPTVHYMVNIGRLRDEIEGIFDIPERGETEKRRGNFPKEEKPISRKRKNQFPERGKTLTETTTETTAENTQTKCVENSYPIPVRQNANKEKPRIPPKEHTMPKGNSDLTDSCQLSDNLIEKAVIPLIEGSSGLPSASPAEKISVFSPYIKAAEKLGYVVSEKELRSALRKTQSPDRMECISLSEQKQLDIYNRLRDYDEPVSRPPRPLNEWDIIGSGEVKNEGAKDALDSYYRTQVDDKLHVDYGKFPPDLHQHIKRFVELSGISPTTKQDYRGWQAQVTEWREAGLSVANIERAVLEIKSHNRFRIARPSSITLTAKSIMQSKRR
jgi:hypothetical protein